MIKKGWFNILIKYYQLRIKSKNKNNNNNSKKQNILFFSNNSNLCMSVLI